MDEREQRQILEEIARDKENYPRDRIAAVRALREIAEPARDALADELHHELERLIPDKDETAGR